MYALGDCAAHHEKPLAMLAQVANQQGIYLAKKFNEKEGLPEVFKYKFLGSMASLGPSGIGTSAGPSTAQKRFLE